MTHPNATSARAAAPLLAELEDLDAEVERASFDRAFGGDPTPVFELSTERSRLMVKLSRLYPPALPIGSMSRRPSLNHGDPA